MSIHKDGREKAWESLPRLFGLPDWNDLKNLECNVHHDLLSNVDVVVRFHRYKCMLILCEVTWVDDACSTYIGSCHKVKTKCLTDSLLVR